MKGYVPVFISALFLSLNIAAKQPSPDTEKININTASHEELQEGLVGIGERNATEIINYRKEHGSFKTLEDFDKVKYVGPKLLDKNKDRIVFE